VLALDRGQRESLEHQFFDTSPDGVVVIGMSGHILAANRAQARMYRYDSPEGLVGVPAPLLVAPDCRDFAARIMHRRLSGEEIPPVEYELIRKDGTTFYGETSAANLRTADGAIWGYICTTRDTTERRRADELLRQSEKRYEVMFDSAPLAINVTKGTAITYANPAYLEMFGASSLDELRGLPPLELISPG
jgi:PAS domain S-box-containing protein